MWNFYIYSGLKILQTLIFQIIKSSYDYNITKSVIGSIHSLCHSDFYQQPKAGKVIFNLLILKGNYWGKKTNKKKHIADGKTMLETNPASHFPFIHRFPGRSSQFPSTERANTKKEKTTTWKYNNDNRKKRKKKEKKKKKKKKKKMHKRTGMNADGRVGSDSIKALWLDDRSLLSNSWCQCS